MRLEGPESGNVEDRRGRGGGSGGGMRGGNLVGASDRTCAFPAELPVGPADVVATIYHALGLAPHTTMFDPLGRPMTISDGQAISQLF